jgi:hypothetical protein
VGSGTFNTNLLVDTSGTRLRMDATTPARDLMLLTGSVSSGAGTIQFDGGNRLALSGNVVVGIGILDFLSSSSITGTNLLTIAPGSTVSFDHDSTIPGSVTVDGTLTVSSASATLTITDSSSSG